MKKNSLKNINKTGFKVPKDYFENFEDILLSELKLKKTSAHPGFKVPKDYFENLDDQIINAIEKNKNHKVIPIFSWRKATYIAAVAASLVLMFNVLFNKKERLNMESIETASIENYILNEELETNDIASLFSDEDLSEITSIKNSLSSETLEDYVLDNLDINELITNNN